MLDNLIRNYPDRGTTGESQNSCSGRARSTGQEHSRCVPSALPEDEGTVFRNVVTFEILRFLNFEKEMMDKVQKKSSIHTR